MKVLFGGVLLLLVPLVVALNVSVGDECMTNSDCWTGSCHMLCDNPLDDGRPCGNNLDCKNGRCNPRHLCAATLLNYGQRYVDYLSGHGVVVIGASDPPQDDVDAIVVTLVSMRELNVDFLPVVPAAVADQLPHAVDLTALTHVEYNRPQDNDLEVIDDNSITFTVEAVEQAATLFPGLAVTKLFTRFFIFHEVPVGEWVSGDRGAENDGGAEGAAARHFPLHTHDVKFEMLVDNWVWCQSNLVPPCQTEGQFLEILFQVNSPMVAESGNTEGAFYNLGSNEQMYLPKQALVDKKWQPVTYEMAEVTNTVSQNHGRAASFRVRIAKGNTVKAERLLWDPLFSYSALDYGGAAWIYALPAVLIMLLVIGVVVYCYRKNKLFGTGYYRHTEEGPGAKRGISLAGIKDRIMGKKDGAPHAHAQPEDQDVALIRAADAQHRGSSSMSMSMSTLDHSADDASLFVIDAAPRTPPSERVRTTSGRDREGTEFSTDSVDIDSTRVGLDLHTAVMAHEPVDTLSGDGAVTRASLVKSAPVGSDLDSSPSHRGHRDSTLVSQGADLALSPPSPSAEAIPVSPPSGAGPGSGDSGNGGSQIKSFSAEDTPMSTEQAFWHFAYQQGAGSLGRTNANTGAPGSAQLPTRTVSSSSSATSSSASSSHSPSSAPPSTATSPVLPSTNLASLTAASVGSLSMKQAALQAQAHDDAPTS